MKYSFMSFSAPDASLAELVGLAARLGYDGIEPRIDAGHKHGVEVGISHDKCAEYKKIAADAGIGIACVATSCRFADDTVAAFEYRIREAGALARERAWSGLHTRVWRSAVRPGQPSGRDLPCGVRAARAVRRSRRCEDMSGDARQLVRSGECRRGHGALRLRQCRRELGYHAPRIDRTQVDNRIVRRYRQVGSARPCP